ncbi:related to cell division control protein CDC36 [Rhynchosporium secalis]|uniref:Related to cell division control protein CDC36 n=1 Tax=Rhynchosporium secalis TaxID=38038 RepID=A0A1E1M5J0_RHYSE|nr:related to cell division control protein CDC36 [Rhynchosporium secalis]
MLTLVKAVGPQSLRGMPNGFQAQQQIVSNRSVSSRLPPSGKMAGNGGTTWGFGGLPMGSAGLANTRPSNAPMTSFAQTIGGSSQPATPLDLSEFPSLSNNQPQPSQSAWTAAGARPLGPSTNMRLQQQSGLSSQQQLNNQQQTQQQQEDLFSSSSQLPSSQGGFRFGSQNAVGQSSQSNPVDDFPPLNRNANGEIGQDRGSIPNVGFGPQSNSLGFGLANPPQSNRSNGLLNALSGSNRVIPGNRVASPGSISGLSVSRSPTDGNRHASGGLPESDTNSFSNAQFPQSTQHLQREETTVHSIMSRTDGPPQQEVARSQTVDSTMGSVQSNAGESNLEVQDPLPGMSEMDRWGLKGFSVMMNNFPDYAALVTGTDMANFGFDLNSNENISSQIYSLWENEPPQPAVPRFTLPECYTVGNVAALETKMSNFNDEALIFMFYSNPGDVQQLMAASELHNRNWRYHKKLQLWLTKDEMMVPQSMGNGTERGYYIFFDIKQWHRERREFTLIYDDLENPSLPSALPRALVSSHVG